MFPALLIASGFRDCTKVRPVQLAPSPEMTILTGAMFKASSEAFVIFITP